jgi:hypothetical protein
MSIATALERPAEDWRLKLLHLSLAPMEQMCGHIDTFLEASRRFVLDTEPTPEILAEHKSGLLWLLRCVRLLNGMMSDPEYPHHPLAQKISIRLWKLEERWKQVHEPMPDAEYDALVARHFPEHGAAA